jgi:hypothetical protein
MGNPIHIELAKLYCCHHSVHLLSFLFAAGAARQYVLLQPASQINALDDTL